MGQDSWLAQNSQTNVTTVVEKMYIGSYLMICSSQHSVCVLTAQMAELRLSDAWYGCLVSWDYRAGFINNLLALFICLAWKYPKEVFLLQCL